MKPKVYIETSVISYLTARPSRDIVALADQETTWQWWDQRRGSFDLYASQYVVDEAAAGNPTAAGARITVLRSIPLLETNTQAILLVTELIKRIPLPPKAVRDAAHIAVASVNGMDFLLTWNCRHIANAAHQRIIEKTCRLAGVEPPIICTPRQLLEESP